MITVHHLEHSRSQRILWLLEELQLPYEVVRYARDAKTLLAPASLKRVHPLGKSPVLEDEAVTYVESGAIMTHLTKKHGRFGPPSDPVSARRWLEFMHSAEGSLLPPLFAMLREGGNVANAEMVRTFNCGIGMVAVVAEEHVGTVIGALTKAGETPHRIGRIEEGAKGCTVVGDGWQADHDA